MVLIVRIFVRRSVYCFRYFFFFFLAHFTLNIVGKLTIAKSDKLNNTTDDRGRQRVGNSTGRTATFSEPKVVTTITKTALGFVIYCFGGIREGNFSCQVSSWLRSRKVRKLPPRVPLCVIRSISIYI